MMQGTDHAKAGRGALKPYLTPLGAWALAFGCAVGWGSFVMPGNVFLPQAGPLGTVLGILIGALLLMLIALNYRVLISRYPDAGGAFTYAKKIFGYDHGFLCAWFLILTYIAIIWANATALPLIARNVLGTAFQFGFRYEIAGFSIFSGEILLSCTALAVCAVICLWNHVAKNIQILMALILVGGAALCFIACWFNHEGGLESLKPAFAPQQGPALKQVIGIVFLAPWAYIGFESISHSSEEFTFPHRKSGRIMILSLLTAALVYSLLAICAVTELPRGFGNWPNYINHLAELNGVKGLPTFFATESALGDMGILLLGVTALGGIITGLVGNCIAASRLVYSMAVDDLLPDWFGRVEENHTPRNAILFIMIISMIIPFFGRTAIGWIVDVTTVGAAMVYAYCSAATFRLAREEGNRLCVFTGAAGVLVAMAFLLYFLIPNILLANALAAESYLILAAWGVLGFLLFRVAFKHDVQRRFGRSTIVWIVLLGLIYFTSSVWMRQTSARATEEALGPIHQFYMDLLYKEGLVLTAPQAEAAERYLHGILQDIGGATTLDLLVQTGFIVTALAILFNIYSMLMQREKKSEAEKALAEESSRAKTSFLSNMSHEIRTPMNAIIGLDNIALKDPDLPPRTRDQLEKIGASANHLLGLINDILDMSRIESGRMVLKKEEFVFKDFLDQINVIINGQCQDKGLSYECDIIGQVSDYYVGDDMKLKQVLINILGNAVKFTESPGTVTFQVEEISRQDGECSLCFTMKDTGIGMDPEYIPKIFEAFTQEDATTTNRYGGSGLGMAITKNIVEMMEGHIDVQSQKGVGSTFTVIVSLGTSDRALQVEDLGPLLQKLRVLVIDDDPVACEHARLVLENVGIHSDICDRSTDAYSLIRRKWDDGNPYNLILTDMRMPVMDGVTLTEEIRRFDQGRTAILIMTGYDSDAIQKDAVDGILSKPLFADSLLREIRAVMHAHDMIPADMAAGEASDAAEGGLSMAAPAADPPEEESFDLEGLRVLMAEDIELNAEILSDILEMEDVESERAENGQIAVDMFSASEPGYYDAILMDIRMPVMDGLTATEVLRGLDHPDAASIPIIAMTANAFDEDVQNSLRVGMNAHLSKPIDPDQLYATLGQLTRGASGSA